ncbi:MAG: mechanosensitive ion channel family protein, partial [Blastocatellia bacterium]|nr:mechanosensitive ion channel family protein [Blastocatellia bacterium]
RRAISTAMERTGAEQNVRFLVVRAGSIIVWLIGIAVTLNVLKINMGTTLAAFGVTGAAIGFAIHDVIANFVAGVILLSIRPFKLGDTVTIDVHEGKVERVEIRVTVLNTADGREVSIPNSKVFSSIIVNHSTHNQRRSSFQFGVAINADIDKVKEVVTSATEAVDGVLNEPPPGFIIVNFNATTVNVEVQFWIEAEANSNQVSTEVKKSVKQALQAAQIELAPK